MAPESWKPFRLAAYKGRKGLRFVQDLLIPISDTLFVKREKKVCFGLEWCWAAVPEKRQQLISGRPRRKRRCQAETL